MGIEFNFSPMLSIGTVTGKYKGVGDENKEDKSRLHLASLSCLLRSHLPFLLCSFCNFFSLKKFCPFEGFLSLLKISQFGLWVVIISLSLWFRSNPNIIFMCQIFSRDQIFLPKIIVIINIIVPLQNSMHYNPFWQRNCHQGNTSTWVDRNLLNDNLMNRVAIFIKNTSTFVLLYDLTTLTLRIWHINWHVAAKLCQRVRDTIWWRRT